jgi:hypothetical protein
MWGQPPSAVRRAQRGKDVEEHFVDRSVEELNVEERPFRAASAEENE